MPKQIGHDRITVELWQVASFRDKMHGNARGQAGGIMPGHHPVLEAKHGAGPPSDRAQCAREIDLLDAARGNLVA